MKHTPGPWTPVHHKTHSSIQLGDDFGVVDVVEHSTISREENKANARLIAAAPELLEALENYISAVTGPLTLAKDLCAAENAARQAIAKAKG